MALVKDIGTQSHKTDKALGVAVVFQLFCEYLDVNVDGFGSAFQKSWRMEEWWRSPTEEARRC
jgi:hypothetical protein